MNTTQIVLNSTDPAQQSSFRLEDDVLHIAWKRFGDAGNVSFHLEALSPELSYHESFRGSISGPTQVAIFGLLILSFSAFSELDTHEKAAWFIIGGAITSIGALITATRMKKSRITWVMKKDGNYAAAIDHALFEIKELESFKNMLSERIKEAKMNR